MNSKKTGIKRFSKPVLETLEPRVLFSADPLSASIGVLLLPDESQAENVNNHVLDEIKAESPHAPVLNDDSPEIVFIGEEVTDIDSLKETIYQSAGDRVIEIHTIAADIDGVAYIDKILASYSSVSAVHILTHGSTAGIDLGNVRLNLSALESGAAGLEGWRSSLSTNADILLYGCNLAATDEGVQLLHKMGQLTGADVSASENATGSRQFGGDWLLEYKEGEIQTESIVSDAERSAWRSVLAAIVVDTVADNVDVDADLSSVANLDLNPGADGRVSLREAILAANNDAQADSITLLPGTYVLDSSQIEITNPLSISGDSASSTILDANFSNRFFQVQSGAGTVSFTDLTMMQALGSGAGAALWVGIADVTIDTVIFQDNETNADHGGAIFANTGSTLTITDSIFDNNTAQSDGGAIYTLGDTTIDTVDFTNNSGSHGGAIFHVGGGAPFSVLDSYFYNNHAAIDGGAISARGNTTISGSLFESNIADDDGGGVELESSGIISNSTFYGNSAGDNGGGLIVQKDPSSVLVDSVTFVNNTAPDRGGALHNENNAVVTVTNSLFEGNSAAGNEATLAGTLISGGFNLMDTNVDTGDVSLTASDRRFTAANVGDLEDNGGPQKTVSLNSNSPAINSGSSTATDATGQQRNEIADVGAFEYRGAAPIAKFYWTDHDPKRILRSDLDGGDQQEIYRDTEGYFPFDVEVDAVNGYIYWAESTTQLTSVGEYGRLMQARMDGSDPTVLLTGLDNPTGVAVDSVNGYVYFTVDATTANSQGDDAIRRYNLSNGSVDTIYSAAMGVHRFYDVEYDADNNMLYWSDYGESAGDRKVFRKDLSTADPIENITPQAGQNPLGLTVDPNTNDLFWLNGDDLSFYDDSDNSVQFNGVGLGSTIGVQYHDGSIYYVDTLGGIGRTDATASSTAIAAITGGDPVGLAITTLSAVSDNPVLDVNVPGNVIEGGQMPLTDLLLSVTDDDTADADIVFSVQSQLPAGGGFRNQFDVAVTQFTLEDIKLSNIYFEHDGTENGPYSFSIDVSDGDPDTISVEGATFTINVTLVNDPPVGTSKTISVSEDDQISLVADDFGFTDPQDPSAGHSLESVTIVTAPGNGTLWLGAQIPANVVTNGQVVLEADLANLSYRPATDGNGTAYDTIDFRVTDSGGDTDTTTRVLTIDVTAVNDAPVGTSTTLSVDEDDQLDLVAGNFGFTDPQDVGNGHTLQSVTIMTAPTYGTLWLGAQIPANEVTDGQVVLAADIATLSYRPPTDANGTAYDTIGFRVTDNAGGADTDTTTRILTIDVTAVNDAPVGTSTTLSVDEDDQLDLVAGDFGFTDPQDVGNGHTLQSVTIMTAPTNGTLWLGAQIPANEVTDGQVVLVADIATLSYRPATDGNGTAYDTIGFRVTDNAGGADTDTTTRILTIDVTAVNDAPVGTSTTLSVAEEGQLDLVAGNFGFTDPQDASAGHTLQSVTIMTVPTNGTLWLGAQLPANEVTDGQVVLAADIATLSYRPATDGYGNAYDTIGFRVTDNAGGADTDTITRTLTIDVGEVNDAPVVGNAVLLAINEDLTDPLGATIDSLFGESFTDSDAADTLSGIAVEANPQLSEEGRWQYAFDGVEWTDIGDVDSSNALILNGATSIRFLPTLNFNGTPEPLIVRGLDSTQGLHSVAGTPLSINLDTVGGSTPIAADTNTLSTTVLPVSDAPQAEPLVVNVGEDLSVVLDESHFGFSDVADDDAFAAVIVSAVPSSGELRLGSVVVAAEDEITLADIKAGLLSYHTAPDLSGNSAGSFAFQVRDTGVIPPGENTSETQTLIINVIAVADAPTIADASLPAINEDSVDHSGETLDSLFAAGFSDVDIGDTFAGVAVVNSDTEIESGTWQYSSDGRTWNSIAPTSPSNALILEAGTQIRFLPALNFYGTPSALQVLGLDSSYNGAFSDVDNEVMLDTTTEIAGGSISINTVTLGSEVTPVDDKPTAILLAPNSVSENTTDVTVGTLTTVDVDGSPSYTYQIDDPRFEIVGDELRLIDGQSLDFESESQISLTVRVTDAAGDVFDWDIVLAVLDTNDEPELAAALETQTLFEGSSFMLPASLFIDPDADDTLSYTAYLSGAEQAPLPSWLIFNEETRSFTVEGLITEASEVDVIVAATDQSGATETTLVRIVLSPPPAEVAEIAAPVRDEAEEATQKEEIDTEPQIAAAEATEKTIEIEEASAPVPVSPLTEEIVVVRREIEITEPDSLVRSAPEEVAEIIAPEALEDVDTQSLELLFTLVDDEISQSFANLSDLMDRQWEEARQDSRFARQVVGSSAAITSGFSVGYILWLVRGGTLIGSVLSALPAWRFIDPLPILDSLEDGDDESDNESLEQMVDSDEATEEAATDHFPGNPDAGAPDNRNPG